MNNLQRYFLLKRELFWHKVRWYLTAPLMWVSSWYITWEYSGPYDRYRRRNYLFPQKWRDRLQAYRKYDKLGYETAVDYLRYPKAYDDFIDGNDE